MKDETKRTCPRCRKPAQKYGEPTQRGVFFDQVVHCPACGWCNVETEILCELPALVMKQIVMFTQPPAGG